MKKEIKDKIRNTVIHADALIDELNEIVELLNNKSLATADDLLKSKQPAHIAKLFLEYNIASQEAALAASAYEHLSQAINELDKIEKVRINLQRGLQG